LRFSRNRAKIWPDFKETQPMLKRCSAIALIVLMFTCAGFSRPHSAMKKPSAAAPDKAYMQKIWDGWSTLDPANVTQFYASGPHVFFDITPLKYASWVEYQQGSKKVLSGYKSGKCTVNDDAEIHSAGDTAWGTATVTYELTSTAGKVEMGNFRWTVIWERQSDGKWLTVHEHVSEPLQ
jgi:ketosteroid isomerase-like protein